MPDSRGENAEAAEWESRDAETLEAVEVQHFIEYL
jgi:hypothetical protein